MANISSNKRYSILPSSSLHSYFLQLGKPTSDVAWSDIFKFIKDLILAGRHFDERNPSMILCMRSQQLENIFSVKALHVTQVHAALAKSLIALETDGPEASKSSSPEHKSSKPSDPNTRYRLCASLRQLFESIDVLVKSQELFTFLEAADLLSQYIILKKDHILDSRNIGVALIDQDPLGKVFKVAAFHRNQASKLLMQHLIVAQEPSLSNRILRSHFLKKTTAGIPTLNILSRKKKLLRM